MKELTISMIVFLIIYCFYYLFVIKRKRKLEQFKKNIYVLYLINTYGIDISKVSFKNLAKTIAASNAFIIALTLFAISAIPNFILKMISGFLLLIPFQFFIYHLIGKSYQKKLKNNL